jgi:hypothetical protein
MQFTPQFPVSRFLEQKKKKKQKSASVSTTQLLMTNSGLMVAFNLVTARVAELLMSVVDPRTRYSTKAPLSMLLWEAAMKSR